MKNKEELADDYEKDHKGWYDLTTSSYVAGFDAAIEKVKEYLFNTEEHQDKDGKFYISEDYLKQIIKFLNEQ